MFDCCLYFNLNVLTRTINRIWEEAFQRLGLSPSHAYLLRLVLGEPGITQKRVAQALGLAPSTVTRFVDALAAKGLLERGPNAADARESALYPTAAGQALEAELDATGQALFQRMRSTLGAERFDQLVTTLREAQAAVAGQ
ncbi:MarR family transcriptional regulator [Thermithiobacillus tepidarius DSM 3134]|uniref:MarR family winged helix-turn-helix transcriptional regulator n=1 Tax=Thermithiobacillus tepidarius TaxID=929 RepID=UPI0003FAD457|nr:MarR family transcriptional regulator [Thermithiobacillus tepidarius]